jgi:hypothetical protein
MTITQRSLILAVLAISHALLVGPAIHAQCTVAREIAMAGNGGTHGRIGVDTQASINLLNNQTEVATFWESGNPGNNTGGPHFGTTSSCPSATAGAQGPGTPWWRLGGTGGNQPMDARSIQMFLSSTGCTLPVCPGAGASLTVLVEDITVDGSDAGFYLITADETPGPIRWYNLARADPLTQGSDPQPSNDVTHPMVRFPDVHQLSSSGSPPNQTVTVEYSNIDVNVWGVGPHGQPSQQVTSYDIFAVHAPVAPPRTRADWGAPHRQIPFTNTPPGEPLWDSFVVPCPTREDDTYIAVGLTFDGTVPSHYVGAATAMDCEDYLADPDALSEPRRSGRGIGRRAVPRRGR